MAGTARAGAQDDQLAGACSDTFAPMLGMPGGTVPFGQWPSGLPTPQITPETGEAGEHTADTEASAGSKVIADHAGSMDEVAGPGKDWFGDVHIMPRTEVQFGNIITQKDEEYEIYSAYCAVGITINSVDESAVDPGINLPGMTTPLVVPPGTSVLDASSTDNSSGTGLGSLVKLKVEALATGRPKFTGSILFSGSGELVSLVVSGSRIVFIPFEYEAGAVEILAFLTNIIEAISGVEQRIALRKHPRQLFEVTYKLDENDRRRMQALLMSWMPNTFGFPLWHEQTRLTSTASVGATTYDVQDTTDIDLREGGLAVVITDNNTYDVITIDSITPTTIVAEDPSLNSYPAGTRIMPLRTAVLKKAVSGQRAANNLETFTCTFEVSDNSTGALGGSTAPGSWSIYDGRVLFDDCNVIGSGMQEEFAVRLHRIDNQTGNVWQDSDWDRSKRSHQKGFVMRNREQILEVRQLLQSLQGRTTAFWIPTFIEDLEVVADLGIGADTMDINRVDYQRFVAERMPKSIFRITFTDNTQLVREITGSADHPSDADKERLTLDDTWPATRTVAEIRRVEFYELVRFDADEFRIEYPRLGLGKMTVPVKQVFDDNG